MRQVSRSEGEGRKKKKRTAATRVALELRERLRGMRLPRRRRRRAASERRGRRRTTDFIIPRFAPSARVSLLYFDDDDVVVVVVVDVVVDVVVVERWKLGEEVRPSFGIKGRWKPVETGANLIKSQRESRTEKKRKRLMMKYEWKRRASSKLLRFIHSVAPLCTPWCVDQFFFPPNTSVFFKEMTKMSRFNLPDWKKKYQTRVEISVKSCFFFEDFFFSIRFVSLTNKEALH